LFLHSQLSTPLVRFPFLLYHSLTPCAPGSVYVTFSSFSPRPTPLNHTMYTMNQRVLALFVLLCVAFAVVAAPVNVEKSVPIPRLTSRGCS
jgi:hypothetical protein